MLLLLYSKFKQNVNVLLDIIDLILDMHVHVHGMCGLFKCVHLYCTCTCSRNVDIS